MTAPTTDLAADLQGHWHGTNLLWLGPSDPARQSESTAEVRAVAGGYFLQIRYTWADGGAPQEGVILLSRSAGADGPAMAWVDSWHMRRVMMVLMGEPAEEGVTARGSYAAPPGPDWGWRISVAPLAGGRMRIAMFNITPDGAVHRAVEATYDRIGATTPGATS